MLKLIISDLDGTFLDSNGSFNKIRFEEILKKMKEKEVTFAACTGKQCERVEELFGDLANDIWILGDSATRIKYKGSFIYESLLPNKLGLTIIKKLTELSKEHVIIACTPSSGFILNSTAQEHIDKVRGSYAIVEQISDLQEIEEDFVKITVFDPAKKCFETKNKLVEFTDKAYIIASEAEWIDITNANVHKGTTVKELQKLLNIKKNETISFGDGYNDLELFSESGSSFAMKNAFSEVRNKASFITKSNDEDGVMFTIEKMLDIKY